MHTSDSWANHIWAGINEDLEGNSDFTRHHKKKSLEFFTAKGWPTGADEDWKYTQFDLMKSLTFKRAPNEAIDQRILDLCDLCDPSTLSARVVLINGRWASQLSFTDSKQPSASQVVIESDRGGDSSVVALSDSNLSLSDNMKPWDSDLLKPSFGAMGALNGALNEAGVRLIVRNGVQLDKPIEIVNIATGDGNDDPFAQFPALKIEVGHSGSVKIMERFLTPDPQLLYFTCARTSIVAGANSAIDFLKVQEEGCNARHWHGTEVVLERDARCCVTTVNFGSRLARNEVIGHVAGDNSHLKLYGLTIGGSEQHIDNNTTIDHLVPHCDSTELYKGVYAGASTGVFGGTIIVRQAAQKTNAMQSNNAVLLSSQATYNTRPCLKIWADDVKCSHGATVGQLDEEAIFYLMSRGVPRNQARTMVTEAFACSTLEGLSDVMRAWIAPRVKSRLAEV